jgi:chemotaxis protein histidine kinase CheA
MNYSDFILNNYFFQEDIEYLEESFYNEVGYKKYLVKCKNNGKTPLDFETWRKHNIGKTIAAGVGAATLVGGGIALERHDAKKKGIQYADALALKNLKEKRGNKKLTRISVENKKNGKTDLCYAIGDVRGKPEELKKKGLDLVINTDNKELIKNGREIRKDHIKNFFKEDYELENYYNNLEKTYIEYYDYYGDNLEAFLEDYDDIQVLEESWYNEAGYKKYVNKCRQKHETPLSFKEWKKRNIIKTVGAVVGITAAVGGGIALYNHLKNKNSKASSNNYTSSTSSGSSSSRSSSTSSGSSSSRSSSTSSGSSSSSSKIQDAKEAKKIAETEIKKADIEKQSAEKNKQLAEQERKKAQEAAQLAEKQRQLAEQERKKKELEAERLRKLGQEKEAEKRRQLAEQERKKAQEAEKARQEAIRKAQEAEKARQEEIRKAQEAEKRRQEEARIAQEAERIRQEEIRKAQEAEKARQEAIRAEKARQEEIRAEKARQEAIRKAEEAEKRRQERHIKKIESDKKLADKLQSRLSKELKKDEEDRGLDYNGYENIQTADEVARDINELGISKLTKQRLTREYNDTRRNRMDNFNRRMYNGKLGHFGTFVKHNGETYVKVADDQNGEGYYVPSKYVSKE